MRMDYLDTIYGEFAHILDVLSMSLNDKNSCIKEMYAFYVVNKRHMYSFISKYINKNEQNIEKIDFIMLNIKSILIYLNSLTDEEYRNLFISTYAPENSNMCNILEKSKLVEKIEKLYDHISLERERATYSMQNQEQNTSSIIQRVNTAINYYNNELEDKAKKIEGDLNTNIMTIVGLFSAIIFVFFGGVSNLTSIFSEIKNTNATKIILSMSGIGIILFNIIFLLLYSISKMTNKNIGRKIIREYYTANRLRYYWEPTQYYYINNKNIVIPDLNINMSLKQFRKDKRNGVETWVKIKHIIKLCVNVILRLHYWFWNKSIVGVGLRRFPHVVIVNIFAIIVIIESYNILH